MLAIRLITSSSGFNLFDFNKESPFRNNKKKVTIVAKCNITTIWQRIEENHFLEKIEIERHLSTYYLPVLVLITTQYKIEESRK